MSDNVSSNRAKSEMKKRASAAPTSLRPAKRRTLISKQNLFVINIINIVTFFQCELFFFLFYFTGTMSAPRALFTTAVAGAASGGNTNSSEI